MTVNESFKAVDSGQNTEHISGSSHLLSQTTPALRLAVPVPGAVVRLLIWLSPRRSRCHYLWLALGLFLQLWNLRSGTSCCFSCRACDEERSLALECSEPEELPRTRSPALTTREPTTQWTNWTSTTTESCKTAGVCVFSSPMMNLWTSS